MHNFNNHKYLGSIGGGGKRERAVYSGYLVSFSEITTVELMSGVTSIRNCFNSNKGLWNPQPINTSGYNGNATSHSLICNPAQLLLNSILNKCVCFTILKIVNIFFLPNNWVTSQLKI